MSLYLIYSAYVCVWQEQPINSAFPMHSSSLSFRVIPDADGWPLTWLLVLCVSLVFAHAVPIIMNSYTQYAYL